MSFKPIHVRPGQVWKRYNASDDSPSKQKLIESLEDGYAYCRAVGIGDEIGIHSTIRVDRLVPRSGGYELVHDPATKNTPLPAELVKLRKAIELVMKDLIEAGKNQWEVRYANRGTCAWLALIFSASSNPYLVATSVDTDYNDRAEVDGFCIELRNDKVLLYAPDPLPPTVWRARLDQSAYVIKASVRTYREHGVLELLTKPMEIVGCPLPQSFIDAMFEEVEVST
jgi:hypothetical protein